MMHQPIRECMGSFFVKVPCVIKYSINYGSIRDWAFIFAKILRVIITIPWVFKCAINYGPLCERASIIAKILLVVIQVCYNMDPFMNGSWLEYIYN